MSAKSNSGEINESYASACQPQETSQLFAAQNEERKWQLRKRQRREDDVPTRCIRKAFINIASANISTVTLGCGPLYGSSLAILNLGLSSLGYKHSCRRSIICCSHLITCETEWHKIVYIRRKSTANIAERRKIRKYSTKHVFLTFIFRTSNSSVAVDGRP